MCGQNMMGICHPSLFQWIYGDKSNTSSYHILLGMNIHWLDFKKGMFGYTTNYTTELYVINLWDLSIHSGSLMGFSWRIIFSTAVHPTKLDQTSSCFRF